MIYRSWGTSHSKARDAILLFEAKGWKGLACTLIDSVPTWFCCRLMGGRLVPHRLWAWYHNATDELHTKFCTTVEIRTGDELRAFLDKQAWWREEEPAHLDGRDDAD